MDETSDKLEGRSGRTAESGELREREAVEIGTEVELPPHFSTGRPGVPGALELVPALPSLFPRFPREDFFAAALRAAMSIPPDTPADGEINNEAGGWGAGEEEAENVGISGLSRFVTA
jgi:hypothetical protein